MVMVGRVSQYIFLEDCLADVSHALACLMSVTKTRACARCVCVDTHTCARMCEEQKGSPANPTHLKTYNNIVKCLWLNAFILSIYHCLRF